MGDASELYMRQPSTLNPAQLQQQNVIHNQGVLHNPNVPHDYGFNNVEWYTPPPPPHGQQQQQLQHQFEHHQGAVQHMDNGGGSLLAVNDVRPTERPRDRRRRAAQEEGHGTAPSPLPEEELIEPPHPIDEEVPIPFTRPCSMARPEYPFALRCAIMLKSDYKYRMCEGCRMRFKLAEVRTKGVRYEGKRRNKRASDPGRDLKVCFQSFMFIVWDSLQRCALISLALS